jgi:hypothetical protein
LRFRVGIPFLNVCIVFHVRWFESSMIVRFGQCGPFWLELQVKTDLQASRALSGLHRMFHQCNHSNTKQLSFGSPPFCPVGDMANASRAPIRPGLRGMH